MVPSKDGPKILIKKLMESGIINLEFMSVPRSCFFNFKKGLKWI
jgi:hypothetical protein